MAHAFRLLGGEHELWLSRAGSGYRLHADGEALPVTLIPRGENAHELVVGDDSHRIFIASRGDEVFVHIEGEVYALGYHHSLARFAGAADEDEGESVSRAPMPGSVIAVNAGVGDKVQRGEPLLIIESMKMETSIAAAFDGVVQEVHVSVGQTFDRDASLVTLLRGDPQQ